MTEWVRITVDGRAYEVDSGQNLLQACLSLGLDLPYFCWHPAMGSVGSCRQCAVMLYQDENDERGRLTMSCMTPVADGQILSIDAPTAHTFRENLIESLMVNHPHDCPVCEEGGECHLQDMTLHSGHINRRYRGPKRTHTNQYLGPLINHEMNRCINCYRCVRFYRDYAGGNDLNVYASRNRVYFGRAESGTLENEFSGNLVEVCPTGVFTDKTYSKHFCRRWDLQSAPAVCTHCSVGCNIHPGARLGSMRRVINRYHPEINGHFLCDRGRFGYEYALNKDKQLDRIWWRDEASQAARFMDLAQARDQLESWIVQASSEGQMLGIGSGRASLETNFALRALVGEANFYVNDTSTQWRQIKLLQQYYDSGRIVPASLAQLEKSDAALVVGEDLTQSAPRIALSLREMCRNAGRQKATGLGVQIWQDAAVRHITQQLKSPLFQLAAAPGKLDDLCSEPARWSPSEQLSILRKIRHYLIESLEADAESKLSDPLSEAARHIAEALLTARQPALIVQLNPVHPALFKASLALAMTLKSCQPDCRFLCPLPEANSYGLSLLASNAASIDAAMTRIAEQPPKLLIVLETDLFRSVPADRLTSLLEQVEHVVVLDHILTETGELADLLLPVSNHFESHGSWLNYEARLQTSIATMPANGDRQPAFKWLQRNTSMKQLQGDLQGLHAGLAGLAGLYPDPDQTFGLARETLRVTGRTAVNAAKQVKEGPPARDADSAYRFSPEGVAAPVQNKLEVVEGANTPPAYFWAPGDNSTEALQHYQSHIESGLPGLKLHADGESQQQQSDSALMGQDDIDLQNTDMLVSVQELEIVLSYDIFRDDELATYAEGLNERAGAPYLVMHPDAATQQGWNSGQWLELSHAQEKTVIASLPIMLDDRVARDVVVVPVTGIALGGLVDVASLLLSPDKRRIV